MIVQMPKLKDRRRGHGLNKKKKECSSHSDTNPMPGRGQSKSNGYLDLQASSQGPPTVAAHASSLVSANWKSLAKVSKVSIKREILFFLYSLYNVP